MENCAFILMGSLPVAWIAVGCLLLILLLVAVVLYLLKVREVAALKKEVFELRDTMRMMRYEEANLARMLHTANRPAPQSGEGVDGSASENVVEQAVAPVEEAQGYQVALGGSAVEQMMEEALEVEEELVAETAEQLIEESAAMEECVAESPLEDVSLTETDEQPETEEFVEEASAADESVAEESTVEVVESGISEPACGEAAGPVETPIGVEVEEEPEVEESVAAPVQKHSINERRPAIPTDLFSAWFAENEDGSVEEAPEVEAREAVEPSAQMEPDVTEAPVVAVVQPVGTVAPVEGQVIVTEAGEVVEEQTLPEQVVETSSEGEATPSSAEEPSGLGLTKEDERFCRKLERIVSTRMRNPNLNVDTIAAQFGIGRTNFYRKVRELTGMSPNDYLRKYRMERAAELLCTTDLPVSDVCVQVGVPDAQYFSKVFKVFFELTPTAYREKNQANQ